MLALQKYRMNKFDGPSEGLRLRHEAGEKKVLYPSCFSEPVGFSSLNSCDLGRFSELLHWHKLRVSNFDPILTF